MGKKTREYHRQKSARQALAKVDTDATTSSVAFPTKAQQTTDDTVPALVESNVISTEPLVAKPQQVALLTEAYEKQKNAQTGWFSFFFSDRALREEQMAFIKSVYDSAKTTELSDLSCESITYGAYLYILNEIESTYLLRAPTTILYDELSKPFIGKTNMEKLSYTNQLKVHLEEVSGKDQIQFGPRNAKKVLAELSELMDKFSSSTAPALC